MLRGKGFGSSVMAAMFISVLGIFFWEVRRYGSKNGYWNGPCMRRHVAEALNYAEAMYPSVRKPGDIALRCSAPPSPVGPRSLQATT